MTANGTVRIAALADLHFAKNSRGSLQGMLTAVGAAADVLVICGDLTHNGRVAEAEVLALELGQVRIPVLAVLGNHDFHAGEEQQIESTLVNAGLQVLDGDAVEVHGIGFAGIKGFAGGFGRHVLEPWGETTIKGFVHETVNEALKLENALAQMTTPQRIVLLHYSPIRATVEGEPLEIYPFMGSSRLEEPINRFRVSAVFHGHAHHGCAEGRTSQGIPVYNVSVPLFRAQAPDGPHFRVIEVDPAAEETPPTPPE